MTRCTSLLVVLSTIALAAVVLLAVLSEDRAPDAPARPRLARATVGAAVDVGTDPVAVAVGAGAVWVVDAADGTLTKIDPKTGTVDGKPRRVGGGPFAVAVGAGAVWVACGDGAISAHDQRDGRPFGPTATVPGANGLAVGAGGVWVSSRRAGTVTRVDPRT
ncbi:MAG: virginiamycin lyase, partial [Solirubrobacteraceae bacterium]|nr:virginiamycin lyase [Solirubrobacteraceae bacterium]